MFKPIGQKIIHLERVDSTNNYAAILISEGKGVHGTVILADDQTAGRGQRGAEWSSKPGDNLLMSIILETDNLSVKDQFVLSEMAALSILHFLRKIGISAQIKWPNDILVGQKKISGILIENQLKSGVVVQSVIGIGLNVNQTVFGGLNATSIRAEKDQFIPVMDLLLSFIHSFNEVWSKFDLSNKNDIELDYLNHLYGMNTDIELEDEHGMFIGRIEGIEPSGKLIVLRGDQRRSYDLKELRFIFQSKS